METVRDPEELGRRLRAARGYAGLSRPELAAKMGISESTVRRREDGDVGALGGKPAKRQATVDAVLEATGAPNLIVLSADEHRQLSELPETRLAAVEEQLADLRRQLETETAEGLEADEESEAQRSESSVERSEASEPGAANA